MQATSTRRPPSRSKAPAPNLKLVIVLAVLVVVFAIICVPRLMSSRAEEARLQQAKDPQVQIKQIQDNPNMPEQAKAIALQQLRAHMGEAQVRSSQSSGQAR